jgi:septation ring formation regulator EzrA
MFGFKTKAKIDSLETAIQRLSELAREQGTAIDKLIDERASHVRELTDIQEQAQRVLNRVHQRTKRDSPAKNGEEPPQQQPQVNPLALRIMGRT